MLKTFSFFIALTMTFPAFAAGKTAQQDVKKEVQKAAEQTVAFTLDTFIERVYNVMVGVKIHWDTSKGEKPNQALDQAIVHVNTILRDSLVIPLGGDDAKPVKDATLLTIGDPGVGIFILAEKTKPQGGNLSPLFDKSKITVSFYKYDDQKKKQPTSLSARLDQGALKGLFLLKFNKIEMDADGVFGLSDDMTVDISYEVKQAITDIIPGETPVLRYKKVYAHSKHVYNRKTKKLTHVADLDTISGN
jgi:hypothetical protein